MEGAMFSAIVLAAGSSTRMGGINKQLAEIGGMPVFVMSAMVFEKSPLVSEIIIASPEGRAEEYTDIAAKYPLTKLKKVVSGGATRALSVKNALSHVSAGIEFISVHDGARPLITTAESDKVLSAAMEYGAAIAAIPATDTVKRSENGYVAETPTRETLYYAQTPQAFRRDIYERCIDILGERIAEATDDSSILEMCGERVRIVPIGCCNMKVTRPEDLSAAQAIYNDRKAETR